MQYVQTVGYVSWYLATQPRGKTPCLACHASLITALAQALIHSAIQSVGSAEFATENGWKRFQEGEYASKFQSSWCESLPFLTESHISKHHMLCKLCWPDFSDLNNIEHLTSLCRLLSCIILSCLSTFLKVFLTMMAPKHTQSLTDTLTIMHLTYFYDKVFFVCYILQMFLMTVSFIVSY